MENDFLLPAALHLLCLGARSTYEALKERKKIDLENKVIFVLIFSAMCALWISWFSLCPADPARLDLPEAIRWIGFGIFAAGMILAVGALIQLRGVENINHLVTGGLFRKMRHPMYAGFVCWIIGWSIYHSAPIGFAIGIVGIANVLWWRHLEERRLEVQFGNDYLQYRLSTWF